MSDALPTLVIAGSVRARRISLAISGWVAAVGREASIGPVEVVDLKDWPLPMDDEPAIPASGDYAFDHTRAWSRKIDGAGALVFVTPQYNWGYPAPLKNALDHLYREWAGKPALIVTYGGHGGGRCGEQLRQVCGALHMRLNASNVELTLPRSIIEANSGKIDPATLFAGQLETLQKGFTELSTARGATDHNVARN